MGKTIVIGRWLSVLVWAALITALSSPAFSFEHTHRFLEWVIGRGATALPAVATTTTCVMILRKTAHVVEYGILTGLLWSAITSLGPRLRPAWSWRRAATVLLLITLSASADEFRQSYTDVRKGQVADIAIDVTGGLFALGLLFLTSRSSGPREPAPC